MSLKYLFDQPNLNVRQAIWLELLSGFDFKIKHVKGKENKVVDSLNKKFNATTLSICDSNLNARVLEAEIKDETYLQVKEKLHQG